MQIEARRLNELISELSELVDTKPIPRKIRFYVSESIHKKIVDTYVNNVNHQKFFSERRIIPLFYIDTELNDDQCKVWEEEITEKEYREFVSPISNINIINF